MQKSPAIEKKESPPPPPPPHPPPPRHSLNGGCRVRFNIMEKWGVEGKEGPGTVFHRLTVMGGREGKEGEGRLGLV